MMFGAGVWCRYLVSGAGTWCLVLMSGAGVCSRCLIPGVWCWYLVFAAVARYLVSCCWLGDPVSGTQR